MVSGSGVRYWFFQSARSDQNRNWLAAPLASRAMDSTMRLKLTAGMPQVTASTARLWMVRCANCAAVKIGGVLDGCAMVTPGIGREPKADGSRTPLALWASARLSLVAPVSIAIEAHSAGAKG